MEVTFPGLYTPFDSLLFFGDNGGGDQFAFVPTPERPDICFAPVHRHRDSHGLVAVADVAGYTGMARFDWSRLGELLKTTVTAGSCSAYSA
ncbi:hypothetical protein [Streptomyces sp. NPDC003393]